MGETFKFDFLTSYNGMHESINMIHSTVPTLPLKFLFKPYTGIKVKVVGWLIQEEKSGSNKQGTGK